MKVTFYKTIDNDSGLVLRINIPGLEIYPVSWTTNDFTVTNTFRRAVPIKNKRFYDNNQGTLIGKSAWKLSSPFCYDNARTCVVLLSERVVFRFIYLPERCVLRSLTLVVFLPVANRITMRSATFKATWIFFNFVFSSFASMNNTFQLPGIVLKKDFKYYECATMYYDFGEFRFSSCW